MYVPKHFEQTRAETLHRLVERHPLATLVVAGAGGLDANHIPLILDAGRGPHGVLMGHVARANPLWQSAANGIAALAVFQGPDAYVSPSLYPSKRETGKVVPTWNYAVVHAHGTLHAIDDPAWLAAFVRRLTDRHESQRAAPWSVDDAPPAFVDAQLGAIVGIELEIGRLVGKYKLSQNRSAADHAGAVAGLGVSGEPGAVGVAELMGAAREP